MPGVRAPRGRAETLDCVDPHLIAGALERWFVAAARDLSWRRTRDAYAIWVSEIMLQQTRVRTVEQYWPRFMERFPTVESLAAASEQDVLEQWSGLGYYRRARLLHRGARHVVDEHGGELPTSVEALRAVPGVGRYTAGAIRSIAHDEATPLVDGNVARVFARYFLVEDETQQGASAPAHWARSAAIVGSGRPRIVAQALMELGATVCVPKRPSCLMCPLRQGCGASREGKVDVIPAPKKRKASPVDELWAVALRVGAKVVLERRPDAGLLAGMWCLPLEPQSTVHPGRTAAKRLGLGGGRKKSGRHPEIRHVFTHRVWSLRLVEFELSRRRGLTDEQLGHLQLVGPRDAAAGGIPSVTGKLLEQLFL